MIFTTSKHLASMFACVVGKTNYTVKNSESFIESVLQPDEVMVSFDVQALYTSIPIDRASVAVKGRLENHVTGCEKTPLSVP